jgi:hypothetical protein
VEKCTGNRVFVRLVNCANVCVSLLILCHFRNKLVVAHDSTPNAKILENFNDFVRGGGGGPLAKKITFEPPTKLLHEMNLFRRGYLQHVQQSEVFMTMKQNITKCVITQWMPILQKQSH